jgi:NADPH-dependent 7-cyano-7-deazaguanine reductase QueF-like protein
MLFAVLISLSKEPLKIWESILENFKYWGFGIVGTMDIFWKNQEGEPDAAISKLYVVVVDTVNVVE